MKTVLVCLFAMLVSMSAEASGKFIFIPRYKFSQEKVTPVVGLAIYEKVYGPVFSNLWVGVASDSFATHQETAYTIKNTFEVHPMSAITLGLGGEVSLVDHDALKENSAKSWRGEVHGKVAVKLW